MFSGLIASFSGFHHIGSHNFEDWPLYFCILYATSHDTKIGCDLLKISLPIWPLYHLIIKHIFDLNLFCYFMWPSFLNANKKQILNNLQYFRILLEIKKQVEVPSMLFFHPVLYLHYYHSTPWHAYVHVNVLVPACCIHIHTCVYTELHSSIQNNLKISPGTHLR